MRDNVIGSKNLIYFMLIRKFPQDNSIFDSQLLLKISGSEP
jgi:hypothetical protein